MFELGARPHPPRELYRAYLDQSHIFIGIYWQRYGWVAPGEAVSGLENEYRLSGDKPKLIYIKSPAEREPRLKELLARIQRDDRASYKYFSTAKEQGDYSLAAQRFDESLALNREADSAPGVALCLAGLASIVGALAQPRRAVQLVSAAHALMDSTNAFVEPSYRVALEQDISALRAQLGEEAFAAAWAQGQALSIEQAIALARSALEPAVKHAV